MSSLQRSAPPLYNGERQLVQTWLTNVQTRLLSDADTDHVAAILEHAHALLQRYRDTDEASHGDKPLIELQVGAQFDRGIRLLKTLTNVYKSSKLTPKEHLFE